MRRAILFIASGAYTGYIPVASGTWGTLVAFPLFWLFEPMRHGSTLLYLATFVAAVVCACWVAGRAEAILQEHDSHAIVIDEIVGYLGATLFMAPTWENTLGVPDLSRLRCHQAVSGRQDRQQSARRRGRGAG
jgi:phosphatidylglycerophosphatase A